MASSPPDFHALQRALTDHGVLFIVVGGVGGALQGVPLVTLDLDIVHDRDPGNVQRLLDVLRCSTRGLASTRESRAPMLLACPVPDTSCS